MLQWLEVRLNQNSEDYETENYQADGISIRRQVC